MKCGGRRYMEVKWCEHAVREGWGGGRGGRGDVRSQ